MAALTYQMVARGFSKEEVRGLLEDEAKQ